MTTTDFSFFPRKGILKTNQKSRMKLTATDGITGNGVKHILRIGNQDTQCFEHNNNLWGMALLHCILIYTLTSQGYLIVAKSTYLLLKYSHMDNPCSHMEH